MPRCKECKAPIWFAVSAQTGKRMPLDPDPAVKGNVWIDDDGYAHAVSAADPAPLGAELYLTHFVLCPGASKFRSKGKRGR
jgi:hypothetical protein